MNLYLIRFPDPALTLVSESLEFEPTPLPKTFLLKDLALSRENILKNDIFLFFKTFKLQNGVLQDMIFAYFEVGRVGEKSVECSKKLSFDKTRAGRGTLGYSRKRVLTRYSEKENIWSLPEFFRCMNITCGKRNLSSSFHDDKNVRYFENTTPVLRVSPTPSRDSLVYYENALLEFVSSMCEDIRGEATRSFANLKKGDTGLGKTGFVKYLYKPDRRSKFYCRVSHTVLKKPSCECKGCSIYKKGGCEWSLPMYGASPYIPKTTADAFSYFDTLLEKGIVMDYRDE